MAYFHFQKPEEWEKYRDIDKKINFEELRLKYEEQEAKELEDQTNAAAAIANANSSKKTEK